MDRDQQISTYIYIYIYILGQQFELGYFGLKYFGLGIFWAQEYKLFGLKTFDRSKMILTGSSQIDFG